MSEVQFMVGETTLDDQSKVFDVVLIDQEGGEHLLFNAPSEITANLMGEALNEVFKCFLECGSDLAAMRLGVLLQKACSIARSEGKG